MKSRANQSTDVGSTLGIPAALLPRVFPFHIAFDADYRVLQIGPSLRKVTRCVESGQDIREMLEIISPEIALEAAELAAHADTVILSRCHLCPVDIKGQMLMIDAPDGSIFLYLCTPVIQDIDTLSELGLSIQDFAAHDSIIDFLMLLQNKSNTIDHVEKLALQLEQEIQARIRTEQQLKQLNDELESRVSARTAEITHANTELQDEIRKRRQMAEQLQRTNSQLATSIAHLKRQNQEIALLNELSDLLQACRATDEIFKVTAESVQKLFPDDEGQLFILQAEGRGFEVVASWGGIGQTGRGFTEADCWALAHRRPKVVEAGQLDAPCNHIEFEAKGGYACVPLLAQDQLLGMIHVRCPDEGGGAIPSAQEINAAPAAEREQILHSAAENIALALANLRLQESLRAQSIRDPLTGLYNRRYLEEALEREIRRALRHGDPLGVIMLDVDHFKGFNDTHGHQAGDLLLIKLAQLLSTHSRSEDVACRYGGEEFLLLLPGCGLQSAMERADELRQIAAKSLTVRADARQLPPVTLSLGVSALPAHGSDAETLIAAADAALYSAKRGGRNRASAATVSRASSAQ